MKSKFTSVAKVKKQALDKIELALLEARNDVKSIENELNDIYNEIITLESPQSGDFSLWQQVQATKAVLIRQREETEVKLQNAQNKVLQLQNDYKNAHLDFEKIKYLEEQEIDAYIKKMKRAEQVETDEIALQLFTKGEKSL